MQYERLLCMILITLKLEEWRKMPLSKRPTLQREERYCRMPPTQLLYYSYAKVFVKISPVRAVDIPFNWQRSVSFCVAGNTGGTITDKHWTNKSALWVDKAKYPYTCNKKFLWDKVRAEKQFCLCGHIRFIIAYYWYFGSKYQWGEVWIRTRILLRQK